MRWSQRRECDARRPRASVRETDAVHHHEYPGTMASPTAPVVDPIRRPHLAAVDHAFRAAIERDVDHCRELLAYLRDR